MLADINGFQFAYEAHGNESGIPIVFIHGFPFNRSTWDSQIAILPKDYYAISYDVRGYGQSIPANGPFSIEFFVDDLIALLDHLKISRTIVCGLSMGGYIALRAYERSPERIAGLILCSTKSEPDTDAGKIARAASVKFLRKNGINAYANESVKSLFASKSLEQNIAAVTKVKEIICSANPDNICNTLIALAARTDTTGILPGIKVRTLIICGAEDKMTTVEVMTKMNNAIRDAELKIIEGAGHLTNLENPDAFNSILLEFLSKFKA